MRTKEHGRRDLFDAVTAAATSTLTAPSRTESVHSPHAAQLVTGFRWLRFRPELEREFRRFSQERFLIRTRIALGFGAILFASFSLRDLRVLPADVAEVTVALRLLVMVPALLLVLALSYVRPLKQAFEAIAATGFFIVMSALATALVVSEHLGAPLPYQGLMVAMVYVILLGGLRFYKASLATLLTAVAYFAARGMLGLPVAETVQQAYYIFVITLIGLAGSYSLELSLRANFLTEHVAVFRATHDALTHLYNRRAALEHLERVWRLAFRERKAVAIALIDVDHFKRYNDRYGHSQGDACLAEVAAVLGDRMRRPMDIAARYGGEEFMVVAYDVTEPSAQRICEDVRRAVESLAIKHPDSVPHGVVTVSVGVAWAQPAAGVATIPAVIEYADAALYRAKAAGRNRCELHLVRGPLLGGEARDKP